MNPGRAGTGRGPGGLALVGLTLTACASVVGITDITGIDGGVEGAAVGSSGGSGSSSGGSASSSSGGRDATASSSSSGSGSSGGSASDGSSGTSSGSGSSGASGSSGTASSSGGSSGADAGCASAGSAVFGAHIKLNVYWPGTAISVAGNGMADIWQIVPATVTSGGGMNVSGTTRLCTAIMPDVVLNTAGTNAACTPGSTHCAPKVQTRILDATFDAISRAFTLSGSQTGWSPGDSISTTWLDVLGLTTSSTFAQASTPWPGACTANCAGTGPFMTSEVSDDDVDFKPGVTATSTNDTSAIPTYTYPPTVATQTTTPPNADQIYLALRYSVALSALRMTDCTHASGTATVTLFDNHVIGCHVYNPAAVCMSPAVSFLDQNRPAYGPSSTVVASTANPITGTVTLQQLSPTAMCSDARAVP